MRRQRLCPNNTRHCVRNFQCFCRCLCIRRVVGVVVIVVVIMAVVVYVYVSPESSLKICSIAFTVSPKFFCSWIRNIREPLTSCWKQGCLHLNHSFGRRNLLCSSARRYHPFSLR